MEELIITKEMREKINNYLGYELIKRNEVGHHIYDEAPGLGKIGIEGIEMKEVVTNKQLDSNGNIEWYKNPNPRMRPGIIKPFHCKLTTVSSRKAKILIASIFPEETSDEKFLEENGDIIKKLREQCHLLNKKKMAQKKEKDIDSNKHLLEPGDMFFESAQRLYASDEDEKPISVPNPKLY